METIEISSVTAETCHVCHSFGPNASPTLGGRNEAEPLGMDPSVTRIAAIPRHAHNPSRDYTGARTHIR